MRQRQQFLRCRDPCRLGVFIGDADALAGVVAGTQVIGGLEEAVADRIVHGLVLGGRRADVGGAVDVDPRAILGAQRLEDDDLSFLERLVVAGAEELRQELSGEGAAEQQHAFIERHDVAGDHERTELALQVGPGDAGAHQRLCERDAFVSRASCSAIGVELGAALHAARLDHEVERILDAERRAARVLAQVEADAQIVEADAGAGESVRVQGLGEACDHIGFGAPTHPFHISGGRRFGDRAATRPRVGLARHLAEGQQLEDADLICAVGLAVLFHDGEQGEIGLGDREDHRDGRVAGDDRRRQRFLQVPTLEDRGVARGVGDIVLVGEDDRVQTGR